MFELVPSQYMRAVFEKLGFELTDFNKATIIWNMYGKTHDEKILTLEELAGTTTDVILKNQIMQRIEYENKMLEVMRKNDGNYIYVVLDEDDLYCGFFSQYEMAYRYGMDNAKTHEEKYFQIDKQRVIFSESKGIPPQGYDGDAEASGYYTAKGALQSIWSNEMSQEDEEVIDSFGNERFEFQFIHIPFEGTVGAQVRDIRNGSIGVLMQDTEGWRRYLKELSEKKLHIDYFDVQVEVVFLTSQGLWSHEHINPIYLEADRYICEDASDESKVKARAIEFFSEYCIRKAKKTNDLSLFEKRVIDSARAYRDICLEGMLRQEKNKCGIIDRAKSVEELMI